MSRVARAGADLLSSQAIGKISENQAVALSKSMIMYKSNSDTLAEAHGRVLNLYRVICRKVPTVIERFGLGTVTNATYARRAIADRFRANAHVRDPRVIDMLVIKGQSDLAEAMAMFMTKHHIMSYCCPQGLGTFSSDATKAAFDKVWQGNRSDFLHKFLQSKTL
eukprot:GILI01006297.1.p2 GENE.GILI01006297.1~~GILI01006297.1.p2  ORF type:complete len:165 (-),score=28.79 GILI01006297.1:97-591(-)